MRKRLGKQRLAASRRADQEDIAFGQFDRIPISAIGRFAGVEPLVVIVDRNRENLLRILLTDHVFVENSP